MAIGMAAGAFFRPWLGAVTLVVLGGAGILAVLLALGVVPVEAARAAWTYLATTGHDLWETVRAWPVVAVTAAIGLAAGLLLREWWAQPKHDPC